MSQERCILITSADGQTGHLTADLLLNDDAFSSTHKNLHLLAHDTSKVEDHKTSGATVVPIDYSNVDAKVLAQSMKDSKANTLLLIPPTHKDKVAITRAMIEAAKDADIPNVVLLSSAGADLADVEKQPRLREFIELEVEVMRCKGETDTQLGHSPVIVRAGLYAEALLLCQKQIQESGKLRLPIGEKHKFAPLALGDVAVLLATILTSQGKHGLGDDVRGQLITLTGPQMCAGSELATAASHALSEAEGSKPLTFEAISHDEAKKLLLKPEAAGGDDGLDPSELEYLLEFYALVRDGRTNYVSTLAFKAATGLEPTLPEEFFKTYSKEFKVANKKKAAAPSGEKRKKVSEPAGKDGDEDETTSPKKTKKVKKDVEVEVEVADTSSADAEAAAKKKREANAVKKAEKVEAAAKAHKAEAAKEKHDAAAGKSAASKAHKTTPPTSDATSSKKGGSAKTTPAKPTATREKTETATEDDEGDYEMKDVDAEIAKEEAQEEKELEQEVAAEKKAEKKAAKEAAKEVAEEAATKGDKVDAKKAGKKTAAKK